MEATLVKRHVLLCLALYRSCLTVLFSHWSFVPMCLAPPSASLMQSVFECKIGAVLAGDAFLLAGVLRCGQGISSFMHHSCLDFLCCTQVLRLQRVQVCA